MSERADFKPRVLTCAFMLLLLSSVKAQKRELNLLQLMPMTGKGWIGGPACLPGSLMAVEDINKDENILGDFNLTYHWLDSQCDAGMAVYQMFQGLQNEPTFVMLLADGCSTASEATAQVSHLWNLTQLSFGSSSPILSNRNRFPNFFRMVPPEQKNNPARIALMKKFNWKKVATINQAVEFFSVVIDDFVQEVKGTDVKIISQEIFMDDPDLRVENLKSRDARIIIISMYEDKAKQVLCKAFKIGLYGPRIVWMIPGWYSNDFWKADLDAYGCTEDQMREVTDGAFLMGHFFKNPVEERGIANLTASEFDDRFYKHPIYDPDFKNYDFCAGQCYDHVWTSALALNCTVQRLEEIGHNKTLDKFTYADSDINDVIFECMTNTSLIGVAGRFVFNAGADPNRMVKIDRIQGGERQMVGVFRQDKEPKYLELIENAIKWKGGVIPRDSTVVTNVAITIPTTLYITMISLSSLGIILALFFLGFNISYKNNRVVKLSSPNINNILLIGCILCYCTVFVKISEAENAILCQAKIFCFTLGFTTVFGSLFSKTWRVYRIFTNKTLQKISIQDYQLFAIIGFLVLINLAVLIAWEFVSPHVMETKSLPKEVYMSGNDAEVHPLVRVCVSDYSMYFGWALYVMQGALLSFGSFLAWETRHVKIEALNDSHQIGLCLYNVIVLSAVGLTLTMLLDDEVVMLYGVTSGCLLLGTTFTQIVIFIPKMHEVYRTKENQDNSTINTESTSIPQQSWKSDFQSGSKPSLDQSV